MRTLFLVTLLLGPPIASAAPTDGTSDPARARVAAQCAAFWEGAQAPARAAPFRALAFALGNPDRTRTFIDQTAPAMRRLRDDARTDARAAALWLRHATLCSPSEGPDTQLPPNMR